jgi:hypothetical protein
MCRALCVVHYPMHLFWKHRGDRLVALQSADIEALQAGKVTEEFEILAAYPSSRSSTPRRPFQSLLTCRCTGWPAEAALIAMELVSR